MRFSHSVARAVADVVEGVPSPDEGGPAPVPRYDHHTHLFSARAAAWMERHAGIEGCRLDADDLLAIMDAEGIRRTLVLSVGYFFAAPVTEVDPVAVAAENDWVAQQVADHPERFAACFGVNPLAASAHQEVRRCAASGAFVGVKLHLANSGVDLRDAGHVAAVTRVVEQAARAGLGSVIHLRHRARPFGAEDVETFVRRILPGAAGAPVQVAHLGGWGGYDAVTNEALEVLARDRHENLYLDFSAVVVTGRDHRQLREALAAGDVGTEQWHARKYGQLVGFLRSFGLERVLFGTDWPEFTPLAYVDDVSASWPLTRQEIATILANDSPLLRPKSSPNGRDC